MSIRRTGWMILAILAARPEAFVHAAEPDFAGNWQSLSTLGSERATTGPGNNILTQQGRTHVVWQDSEANGYFNRVRSLDRTTGEWSATTTLGRGVDNHARPCITVDSQGYLHVVLGGHNTLMTHRRSLRPNDSGAWSKPHPIDDGTYPMLVCGPDDVLVLAARPKSHNGVTLYVSVDGEKWERRDLVLRRNKKYSGYAGYNVATAWDDDGTLHLAADVYEGVGYTTHRGTHQSIVYMKSDDLGRTWTKADGTPLGASVESNGPDVLCEIDVGVKGPAQPARLRNGGIVVDSEGRPYVYFTESEHEASGRPRLTTCDRQGRWRELPLADAFVAARPEHRALGARGHLSLTADDRLHVLVEYARTPPPGRTPERFSWTIGCDLFSAKIGEDRFERREILALDPAHHYCQASLERPTKRRTIEARVPSVLVTDGLQRYPVKGEVIDTKVSWLQPR